ncbi:hypothetical protein BD779DRAFT_627459 [Infundibulicybe gibba]|nr:hypothetical protein BD779DRAFT_627459 [Infundibulicybe gibba]
MLELSMLVNNPPAGYDNIVRQKSRDVGPSTPVVKPARSLSRRNHITSPAGDIDAVQMMPGLISLSRRKCVCACSLIGPVTRRCIGCQSIFPYINGPPSIVQLRFRITPTSARWSRILPYWLLIFVSTFTSPWPRQVPRHDDYLPPHHPVADVAVY